MIHRERIPEEGFPKADRMANCAAQSRQDTSRAERSRAPLLQLETIEVPASTLSDIGVYRRAQG